jgi:peptidoglycan/LPS O-acetylase OafA/YrhL
VDWLMLATKEYARFSNTKKFTSLDGLRAIAILAVIWHHAPTAVPGWQLTTRGFLGVDLFFVISGFLIVTLLLREQRRTKTISLSNFYMRRFLRIFPAYYLMLFLVGATAFLRPDGMTSDAVKRDLPYAFFYISNLVPMYSQLAITWSLSVEEQFYIVVPALMKYRSRAFVVLLPIVYILVCLPPFGIFPSLSFPPFFMETTFGPILLGTMLAYVLDQPLGFSCALRFVGWRSASVIMLGLVVVLAGYSPEDMSGWPRIAVHWAMMGLVASSVVPETNVLRPLLLFWPIRRIGIVSYGIYLYHLLVMHFVLKGLMAAGILNGLTSFVGTSLATWAVAEVSYRSFESRFLALKKSYGSQAAASS